MSKLFDPLGVRTSDSFLLASTMDFCWPSLNVTSSAFGDAVSCPSWGFWSGI